MIAGGRIRRAPDRRTPTTTAPRSAVSAAARRDRRRGRTSPTANSAPSAPAAGRSEPCRSRQDNQEQNPAPSTTARRRQYTAGGRGPTVSRMMRSTVAAPYQQCGATRRSRRRRRTPSTETVRHPSQVDLALVDRVRAGDPVEEQQAGAVVDLVLQRPRLERRRSSAGPARRCPAARPRPPAGWPASRRRSGRAPTCSPPGPASTG